MENESYNHINDNEQKDFEEPTKPCLVQRTSIDNPDQQLIPALKSEKHKCPKKKESITSNQVYHISSQSAGRTVTIVMGNTNFSLSLDEIHKYPDTMLGKMFGSFMDNEMTRPNYRGEYNIGADFTASACRSVLLYYKHGIIDIPPGVDVHDVRDAADFLLIPFNLDTVRSHNLRDLLHEFSNDGASLQFEKFVEAEILPHMLKSAERGDRECHLVILTGEEVIDWDDDYPPQMGEEYTQVIKSAEMHRFFKYVENRDVAKAVLKDRRLKKVRLGIEGYPTYKEKIKQKLDGRYEVIYNYVQRPFIHMSWEKEEARSRHVDFQCVKSKSVTNLADAVAEPEIVAQQTPELQ